jgi:hypothetical protein
VLEETSDAGLCGDLGVTHVMPAFLGRFTIHGRPGATVTRWATKISCPSPTPTQVGGPWTLNAGGTYSETIENTATASCTHGALGRYDVWVIVDGQESVHQVVSYFNSACPTYSTCASVGNACP